MQELRKIVLVDDSITNLTVGNEALSGTYEVYTVPSGEKLLKLLKKITPDLILLDIEMPKMDGYETIKILKGNPTTEQIPVIFLTGRSDARSEIEGLSLGAIDYIAKPFSPPLLLKRIEVHLLVEQQKRELKNYNDNLEEMVREKTETIVELQNAILETVAELVECRDDVTGGHISRTQKYLRVMIDELNRCGMYSDQTEQWDTEQLILSAQLHDVGKIAVRDSILMKPGRLTDEEFEEMKKHALFGAEVIEKIRRKTRENEFLEYAKILAKNHHERWDGTGYPSGLKGEAIPLAARIMAIVDVFDALVSERPYKKAYPHDKAVSIIVGGSGTQFDPALVSLFLTASPKLRTIAEMHSSFS